MLITGLRAKKLIISNIEKDYKEDELWDEIKCTNSGFTENDQIKLMHKKNYKNKWGQTKWAYIIQSYPSTYEKLVNRYVNINFNSRFVKEYINVTRCFNCQSYGHRGAACTSPSICSRCASNHKTNDCTKKLQVFNCVNCVDYNKKSSNKVPINHPCGSVQCHIQKLKVENYKMRISYDCQPEW